MQLGPAQTERGSEGGARGEVKPSSGAAYRRLLRRRLGGASGAEQGARKLSALSVKGERGVEQGALSTELRCRVGWRLGATLKRGGDSTALWPSTGRRRRRRRKWILCSDALYSDCRGTPIRRRPGSRGMARAADASLTAGPGILLNFK